MKRVLTMILTAVIVCSLLGASVQGAEAATVDKIVWPEADYDQEGFITLDPTAGTWEIEFENDYGEFLISGWYLPDGTLECTEDAGLSQFLPLDAIYEAASEIILSRAAEDGAAGTKTAQIVWPEADYDQDGFLSINPQDSTWQIEFENDYGEFLISGDYQISASMECTDDGGIGDFLPIDAIYESGIEAIEAWANGINSLTTQIVWPEADYDQEGFLTLDPQNSAWQIEFENDYGEFLISGDYQLDITMECTEDAGLSQFLPLDAIFTSSEAAMTELFAQGDEPVYVDPETCEHIWRKGVCIVCGTECDHDTWTDGVCDICGFECAHESYDEDTRICDVCGMFIPMDPSDCVHEWQDGICVVCGLECEQPSWEDGKVVEFDPHTDNQQAYLADEDPENISAYAGEMNESQPKALICDFSNDEGIGESETYIFQKSADESFSDPVTITGLTDKYYALYNVLLGEHFYWRGGTSEDTIETSPVHEVQVTEEGPRVCLIEGIINVRDIGGYDSSLVPGGKIRQGLYYRGAAPDEVRESGIDRMVNELGVKAEIDLRDEDQCTGPYFESVEYHPVSIPSGTESTRFEEFAEEYQQIYDIISKADEAPVYLHCSAGADRTGITTFMLLAVCGVDYEDILKDYLFTNFSGQERGLDEFSSWCTKLEAMEGDTMADKAASWMLSKGIPDETIEQIRTVFIDGYDK